ncbi:MAG: 2Fe-2S iron-sulfur cluster binding domain-containing protein [Colwellia sp.]|nr:2Fe-2S iron-sulfur cluster binding domain-containing protein [Colwellia sp.]
MTIEQTPKKHNIIILDTNETFKCSENDHLLVGMRSLEKKGIPSGCHGGGCGVCKVKIHSEKNSYKTLFMSRTHVSKEEEDNGVCLACRVFPLGDIELNVVGKIKRKFINGSKNFVLNY